MTAADWAAIGIAWIAIAIVSGLTLAAAIRRNETRTRKARKGDQS